MVKEGHEQYFNAMGRIKQKKYEAEAAAKSVLLSVQHIEWVRKGSEVINVDDIDDADNVNDTGSLALFLIEFELVGGSVERIGDKTQKRQWKHNSTCHHFTNAISKTKRFGTLEYSNIVLHIFLLMKK